MPIDSQLDIRGLGVDETKVLRGNGLGEEEICLCTKQCLQRKHSDGRDKFVARMCRRRAFFCIFNFRL